MRKYTQKSYETGGVRVGGATNYTDIGTDGALTDAGTQSHNLNELTVTTLAATTNSLTNITATAACATSIPRAGSYTNYISVGSDGAITDTGTQMHALANVHITSLSVGTAASSSGTAQIGGGSNYLGVDADGALTDAGTQAHDLNNVHVTTLSVGTAASSAGTAQIGGESNYLSVGADGALTDTGTQSHSLNVVTITTLTATNIAAQTRYLYLKPGDFLTNSASCTSGPNTTVGSGSTAVIRFSGSAPEGPADWSAVAAFRAPADWLSSTTASLQLITSHTTSSACTVVWNLSASAFGTGEAAAGTVLTGSVLSATSSTADAPTLVDCGPMSGSGIAADDLVLLKLTYVATSASTTRTESDVWNVRVAYRANTLA